MLNIKLETYNTEKMIKTKNINFFKSEIGAAKTNKSVKKSRSLGYILAFV
jgi:hypothetical protein